MFYVSFILLLELKNHLLNLNMDKSKTTVWKGTILYHSHCEQSLDMRLITRASVEELPDLSKNWYTAQNGIV